MANAQAHLKNYRQAPRKVRLVADMIRGKSVPEALSVLSFMPKRAALPIAKLINSAAANARSGGMIPDELIISKIHVGQGVVFKRFMPRARGSASPIKKKSSHVFLELTKRTKKETA